MGSELHFYIHMKPGERVETDLTLPPDSGAILTGVVRRADGRPASDAVILALDGETGEPRCHCVTNWDGRYVLGPLSPALYELCVHDGSAPIRTVDLSL